jgi:DNA-binding MarR family transcriptional regulator
VSSAGADRAELLGALLAEIRATSAHSVLFSQAVADRLGLNPTDVECLDILSRTGPVTAKRLAELAGLTTGGTTFVVDRLERAGYARRAPNPADRRSVLIELLAEPAEREIGPLYAGMASAMTELGERYSDAELAVILDFIARGNAVVREQIARLRGAASPGRASDRRSP